MKIAVTNEYQVLLNKTFNGFIEFDIENYIEENELEITDEWDLKNYIEDFTLDNNDNLYNPEDLNDIFDTDTDNLTIDNLDELIEEYRYLIKEVESICCNNNDPGYTYCPICGKKLK